jgi:hypothetical protein
VVRALKQAWRTRERARVISVTVWALPRSTLVRVGIAHVRSSIYVAQPTSDSQFSAVLPLSSHRYNKQSTVGFSKQEDIGNHTDNTEEKEGDNEVVEHHPSGSNASYEQLWDVDGGQDDVHDDYDSQDCSRERLLAHPLWD